MEYEKAEKICRNIGRFLGKLYVQNNRRVYQDSITHSIVDNPELHSTRGLSSVPELSVISCQTERHGSVRAITYNRGEKRSSIRIVRSRR